MHVEKVRVMASSVRKLLLRDAQGHAARLVQKLRPGDISQIIQELNDRDQLRIFSLLVKENRELAAEALADLGLEPGIALLTALSSTEISRLLQELETDDRAAFVSALPEKLAQQVLDAMRLEESVQVQGLLRYQKETAGRIMTPNVFALGEEVTVSEAIHTLQKADEFEMVFYLYVVDDRSHLGGVISLRQLLTVSPSTPLKKIMSSDVISVATDTDQEEVANQVALYDLLAVPVVDRENKLVGVITVDDVIDVIKEEATEDILHLAGVEADDTVRSTARSSIQKRLPWLGLNLVLALMAATVVYIYADTIADLPMLAIFLPVVAGMGGNSGTQALTLMVRSLALGEVGWKNMRDVFTKELLVGISNGIALGVLAGGVGYIWADRNLSVGLALACAMVCTILLAGILGTLIPLLLNRLNIDPAVASGIFLHTLTDVISFFSFLGLATFFLGALGT